TMHGLTEIVRALKSFSTRRINVLRQTPGAAVWQRSFHDRIIRDEREWDALRGYILTNPGRWTEDRFYGDA
ncbi:MAG: transposase, partial [Anaerolineae bacterium]|nr:transposase [Anaerolineae bacterium]